MPSRRPTTDRTGSSKLPALSALTAASPKPRPVSEDATTQARQARTKRVLEAARRREDQLTKAGYWF